MKINHLEQFVALARYLNFSETASKLNMSQPTLSKHINALERELKTPLFSRGTTSLALTKAGKLILPYAFDIIEARKQMDLAAKKGSSLLAPRLTIGGNVALRTVLERIAAMAEYFKKKYNTDIIEIADIEANPSANIKMNAEDSPDLFFAYIDEADEIEDDSEIQTVAKSPLSIVVDKNHPLAQRDSVTLDNLRDIMLIKLEGNFVSNSWHFIEAICLSAGFVPSCKHIYFPRITDLIKITMDLKTEVLVLTNDYIEQYRNFIAENCVAIPIDDDRAFMPLAVMYSMSNPNPLIDEALEIILQPNNNTDDIKEKK